MLLFKLTVYRAACNLENFLCPAKATHLPHAAAQTPKPLVSYTVRMYNISESNTMLQASKLTSKFQTTVPTQVRKVLQLKAGDLVGFEIVGNEVTLKRATPLDLAFAQALEGTLTEWSSPADDQAFKDL